MQNCAQLLNISPLSFFTNFCTDRVSAWAVSLLTFTFLMCHIQQAQQAAPVTGSPVVLFLLNDIYQKIFARKFPYPSSLTHFYMKFIFFE